MAHRCLPDQLRGHRELADSMVEMVIQGELVFFVLVDSKVNLVVGWVLGLA